MKSTVQSRGFSMIELIFMIVILGILSAVAVPKIQEKRANEFKQQSIKKMESQGTHFGVGGEDTKFSKSSY